MGGAAAAAAARTRKELTEHVQPVPVNGQPLADGGIVGRDVIDDLYLRVAQGEPRGRFQFFDEHFKSRSEVTEFRMKYVEPNSTYGNTRV